jgi:hypothetical protein
VEVEVGASKEVGGRTTSFELEEEEVASRERAVGEVLRIEPVVEGLCFNSAPVSPSPSSSSPSPSSPASPSALRVASEDDEASPFPFEGEIAASGSAAGVSSSASCSVSAEVRSLTPTDQRTIMPREEKRTMRKKRQKSFEVDFLSTMIMEEEGKKQGRDE